jgi:hypothetical protein
MLSKSDMDTVRAVVDVVLDHTNASGAAYDIIDGVLSMVVVDHEYVEQFIRDKNAAEVHLFRALRLASEDMARLVGPCTGVPPTLGKVLEDPGKARDAAIARYAWTAAEAREAASTWYADWLERAEEEATPDA